jgi:hypothetical protein
MQLRQWSQAKSQANNLKLRTTIYKGVIIGLAGEDALRGLQVYVERKTEVVDAVKVDQIHMPHAE